MSFSDQPPSKQWAALTFKGTKLAEVWFKPEGDPAALLFRVPRETLEHPGIGRRLTVATLLKGIAVAPAEVESWSHDGAPDSTPGKPDQELTTPLPLPPPDVPHLELRVRMKPPPQTAAPEESSEPVVEAAAPEESGEPAAVVVAWADVESLWKDVLGIEASVDAMRRNMESLRVELESSLRQTLTADEKANALAADQAQWGKAKNRAHFSLPKASEFISRVTWAATTPDRKRLGELFEGTTVPEAARPPVEEVLRELELLRKNRQILSARGVTVYQECRAIATDVQGSLRRLQSNAASRASQRKGKGGTKGNSF